MRRPAKISKAQKAKAVRTILDALKKRLKITKPKKSEVALLRRLAAGVESSKRHLNIRWPLWGLRNATDQFKREMRRRKEGRPIRRTRKLLMTSDPAIAQLGRDLGMDVDFVE